MSDVRHFSLMASWGPIILPSWLAIPNNGATKVGTDTPDEVMSHADSASRGRARNDGVMSGWAGRPTNASDSVVVGIAAC